MQHGIVCIIDALATKGVWSIDEPNNYLRKLNRIHKQLDEYIKYFKSLRSPHKLEYITFSDTIIITLTLSGFPNETSIPMMVRAIDGVFSTCFAEDLLMRGAISFGKFIKRKNILIGPAVDDAALWHDKAQVIGCVLTPNTTILYESGIDYMMRDPNQTYDYSQHAIKYNVPFKESKTYLLYMVNWPLSMYKAFAPLGPPDPILRFKGILGKYQIPAEAYQKHLNTISFFEYSINQAKLDKHI